MTGEGADSRYIRCRKNPSRQSTSNLDSPPYAAHAQKVALRIDQDYFVDIGPDPTAQELAKSCRAIRRLTRTKGIGTDRERHIAALLDGPAIMNSGRWFSSQVLANLCTTELCAAGLGDSAIVVPYRASGQASSAGPSPASSCSLSSSSFRHSSMLAGCPIPLGGLARASLIAARRAVAAARSCEFIASPILKKNRGCSGHTYAHRAE